MRSFLVFIFLITAVDAGAADYTSIIEAANLQDVIEPILYVLGALAAVWVVYEGACWLLVAIDGAREARRDYEDYLDEQDGR